jgi:HEAT repeat protein
MITAVTLIGNETLRAVAAGVGVLGVIVALLAAALLAHHLLTDRERRGNRTRYQRAAVILAPALVQGNGTLAAAMTDARGKAGDQAVALVLRRARYELKGNIQIEISNYLEQMGEVDRLLHELKSRREWKRAAAIRGLGECGGGLARTALMEHANDDMGEIRRAAREGLLMDGDQAATAAAISSFIADLPRRSGWRRTFYARLAASSGQHLLALIESGTLGAMEEKLALEALGDAARPGARQFALDRLHSASPEMRATAVRVVGKVGTEKDIPVLVEALLDTEWFVRAAAARGLDWLLMFQAPIRNLATLQLASDRLALCLTDPNWWVRANAARALARTRDTGIGVLLRATESNDRFARDAAIAALSMSNLSADARLTVKRKIASSSSNPKLRAASSPTLGGPAA